MKNSFFEQNYENLKYINFINILHHEKKYIYFSHSFGDMYLGTKLQSMKIIKFHWFQGIKIT